MRKIFEKLIELLGVAPEKKQQLDDLMKLVPDDEPKNPAPAPKPADPPKAADAPSQLTPEALQKLIADALAEQAKTFEQKIGELQKTGQAEKHQQLIDAAIKSGKLAPNDAAKIEKIKKLLAADVDAGTEYLNALQPPAQKKADPADGKTGADAEKSKILANTTIVQPQYADYLSQFKYTH